MFIVEIIYYWKDIKYVNKHKIGKYVIIENT